MLMMVTLKIHSGKVSLICVFHILGNSPLKHGDGSVEYLVYIYKNKSC